MIKAITTVFGGNPLDRSLTELKKLQTVRTSADAATIADTQQLAVLKGRQPDIEYAALVGDEGASAAAKELRRDIGDIDGAIAGRIAAKPRLLRQVREAIAAVGTARADVVRKPAQKLREELEAHMAEWARLGAALEKHVGARFALVNQQPEAFKGRMSREPNFNPLPLPRHILLEMEINRLEAEANRIVTRSTQEGGAIQCETLEEILVQTNDMEKLSPTESSVREWYGPAEEQALRAWELEARIEYEPLVYQGQAGLPPGEGLLRMPDRGRVITLSWNADGEIVLSGSSVKSYAVRRPSLYKETPGHEHIRTIEEPDVRMIA